MKKAVIIAALALLALTGCQATGAERSVGEDEGFRMITVDLEDGRSVPCLVRRLESHGSLMTCDWAAAE